MVRQLPNPKCMTLLETQLAEFDEDVTTEVTVVEANGARTSTRRDRRPEDAEVEKICLSRGYDPKDHGCETQIYGAGAWKAANLMIMAWYGCLRRGEDDAVSFTIRFRDGQALKGTIHIRKSSERDLAAFCRKPEGFRRSFCPNLKTREAKGLFRYFLSNYQVPATI